MTEFADEVLVRPLTARRLRIGVPLATALAIFILSARGSQHLELLAIEGLLGIIVLAAIVRWPTIAICVGLPYLAVQTVLLSLVYHYGVPAGIVRGLGAGKELLTAGILVTVLATGVRSQRLDLVDTLAGLYLAVATIYLVVPQLLPHTLGGQSLHVRLLAWRVETLFIIFLLVMRRMRLSSEQRRAILIVAGAAGVLLSAVATYEWLRPTSYNNWLVGHGVPNYFLDVLKNPLTTPGQLLTFSNLGDAHPRAGSTILSPVNFCWFSLMIAGIGLERVSRDRVSPWGFVIATAGVIGIIFSGTRSALLALLVVTAVTVAYASAERTRNRTRLALVLVVAAFALIPVFAHTTLPQRFTGAITGTDTSAAEHRHALSVGYADVIRQPMGRGLGSDPSVGARFDTSIVATPESAYLQVGIELGVIPMLLFAALIVGVVVEARRRVAASMPTAREAGAVMAAFAGFFVGGFFLHVWLSFPTSMLAWGLAGLALPVHPRHALDQ